MPYTLILPDLPLTGCVFASPHSGRDYPADLRQRTVLSDLALRSSEDAYVDLLVAAAPGLGAPLLLARTPRAYVDLNRSADELDPALIEGARRVVHNPRITSGLGVIPRVVANGRQIYSGKLTLTEAQRRLDGHWHPYHKALQGILRDQMTRFGTALLVDCHSMPHEAIETVPPGGPRAPDVVLGDRFGASAAPAIVEQIAAAFEAEGLRVGRNSPFAGAFISQRYGRPAFGQHAVQVEIDRSLYMDEATLTPRPDFDSFKSLITRVMVRLTRICRPDQDLPVAAE